MVAPQFVRPPVQMMPPRAQRLPPPPPQTVMPGPPASAPTPAGRPVIARGKVDDLPPPPPAWGQAPRPTRLSLPAPEQLGVGASAPRPAGPSHVDWNVTHERLRRLGAIGWQLVRLAQGGYRFTFVLPTGQPNHSRHVEGTGATEAEAVHVALASVEAQAAAR